jgi:hypothetical protein
MWKGVHRLGKGFETTIYNDETSYSDIQALSHFSFFLFFFLIFFFLVSLKKILALFICFDVEPLYLASLVFPFLPPAISRLYLELMYLFGGSIAFLSSYHSLGMGFSLVASGSCDLSFRRTFGHDCLARAEHVLIRMESLDDPRRAGRLVSPWRTTL